MKIILPKRNRLINKLFNTIEADEDNSCFIRENLEYVIRKSYGYLPEYQIEIKNEIGTNGKENKQYGQYIVCEKDDERKYIFFSYEFPSETRNGYIVAKIPIAFREYYIDKTKNKKLEIFLLDINSGYKDMANYKDMQLFQKTTSATINNYNTFAYRLCRTLNIKIINEDELPYEKYGDEKEYRINQLQAQKPFKSVEEIKEARDELGKHNLGNKSSYILDFDDMVAIYGKTFGNNGFETILIACAIAKLAKEENKETCFLQIKDTLGRDGTENKEAKPISTENINLLEEFGIVVYDELKEYIDNPDIKISENKDSRNQLEFMKNLMHKYGNTDKKECYLCHCDIQKLIIASHIQRICDINNLTIPFDEKRKKAVDADNGLWLCANHDKLFEYGLIYFEGNKMMISNRLNEKQKEFVKNITYNTSDEKIEAIIKEQDYNENMHKYLEIHKQRVLNY